jgi:hypothetical protein
VSCIYAFYIHASLFGRGNVNKRIATIIAIVAVAVVAITAMLYLNPTNKSKETLVNVEHVGGMYNVTISFFKDGHEEIEYTDETGNHSEHYFEPQMRNGLDWIKMNTPEDAVFLCWWD